MDGIIVTKFQRHPELGYWTARVHNGDQTMEVHHKFGSWQTVPDQDGSCQDVLAPLSYELVARMRTEEGREKRAQEKLAESNPFVKKALGAKSSDKKGKVAA